MARNAVHLRLVQGKRQLKVLSKVSIRQNRRESAPSTRKLSPKKREELILEYRNKARILAASMLRRWRSRLDPQEVESVVDLSLCEAVHRFRAGKGASFMTFLFYHLKGNLVRTVSAAATKSFLPLIDGDSQDWSVETHGYGVTQTELQEYEAREHVDSPESLLLRKEEAELTSDACLKLDPLEQEVMGRLYGHEQQILDIARHLGYSRCHISRVKKKALETLFDELAPTVKEGSKSIRPDYSNEISQASERRNLRRQIQRRRARRNSKQNPRRLLLAAGNED